MFLLMAVMLFFVNKQPQSFNYSVPVTPENAPHMYQTGSRMVRVLRIWVACIFLSIQWMIYDSALHGTASQLNYLVLVCIAGLTVTVGWGIFRFHIKAPK